MDRIEIITELGALIDKMTAAHRIQTENGVSDNAFVVGLGKPYMEKIINVMSAAQNALFEGPPRTAREDKKQDAMGRGDAHSRLQKLIETDTSGFNPEQLDEHRRAIRVALSDKALGA